MATITQRARVPSEDAYQSAANALRCNVSAIKAVAAIEAGPQGAFTDDGFAPTILFERHWFHHYTFGMYDDDRVPNMGSAYNRISDKVPGGYGPFSVQHTKLVFAVARDRISALKSCSWGLFQIMGFNYYRAGYPHLQEFINAMFRGVDDHLDAFCGFILSDPVLLLALQTHDWKTFARLYNGPGYWRSGYDKRIAAAYSTELLHG